MNIEKLKRFNQVILAIFGSLGIVLILVVIIWSISEFTRQFFYRQNSHREEIVSDEIAQKNISNNKRTHQISFENLQLIDTINGIYLVPVSQTALQIEEYVSKTKDSQGVLGLMDSFGGNGEFYYGAQSYNNALVYDSKNNLLTQLFDNRVSINMFTIEKIMNKAYVLLAVTHSDTNKDGIMDEQDYKSLVIYSCNDKKLNEIKCEHADFNSYIKVANKEQLIIKYGLDKNNDGNHYWDEPLSMKIYDITAAKLDDFVDNKTIDKLQGLLDGKK